MAVRILLTGILIFTVFLLAACSYGARFVLVNGTESVLQVHWRVAKEDTYNQVEAKVQSVDEFENESAPWREIPRDRVLISEDRHFASAQLLPGEVLLLMNRDIQHLKNKARQNNGLEMLQVEGVNGSVRFEGDQVFDQFTPSDFARFPGVYTLYTFTYK